MRESEITDDEVYGSRCRTGEHYRYLLDCFKKAQKDFADLQENGLANEFFAAEHKYIAMVKELQEQFLEGSAVETSFLEG